MNGKIVLAMMHQHAAVAHCDAGQTDLENVPELSLDQKEEHIFLLVGGLEVHMRG